MVEAHAPGKLIVCGEYAVLCGAPALAMAVGVRARARVAPVAAGSRLAIAGDAEWPFEWTADGAPRWDEPGPGQSGRILDAVGATLVAHGMALPARTAIELDTRDFLAAPAGAARVKLGLGSSAAITVALTAALQAASGGPRAAPAELFILAAEAHRRFQGGRGSGIDVAVAVHGGVVMLSPAASSVPEVRVLGWPAGLHWLAAWTGRSASTPELLARFDSFRARDRARFDRHLRLLGDLAVAAAGAWQQQDVTVLLRCLADYDDALRALDDGAGIGIYTPEHARLARLAQAAGAVYKVSGAGGGDFGIAFADSAAVIGRVAGEFAKLGVRTLGDHASVAGLVVA